MYVLHVFLHIKLYLFENQRGHARRSAKSLHFHRAMWRGFVLLYSVLGPARESLVLEGW